MVMYGYDRVVCMCEARVAWQSYTVDIPVELNNFVVFEMHAKGSRSSVSVRLKCHPNQSPAALMCQ